MKVTSTMPPEGVAAWMAEPRMPDQRRSERVLAIAAALREGAVDSHLPYGMLAAIGKEHGVTREAVRQIAVQIGLRGAYGLRVRWACEFCGAERESRPSQVKRYCSQTCRGRASRHIEHHVCPECGKAFVLEGRRLITMRNNLRRHIRFTDGYQPACSRLCGTRIGVRKRDALRRAS